MKKIVSIILFSLLILNSLTFIQSSSVTRDNADVIIKVGEKYTLEAVLNYMLEKKLPLNIVVKWESSDTTIATVTKGIVTGVKEGGVIIKASASNNGIIYQAEAKVFVVSTVTGVSLNIQNTTIKVGQIEKLTETVQPNTALVKTVTWKTSDAKIATVTTTGSVKGISAGSVDITVTTKDGAHIAICKVTVVSTVKGVTLTDHFLSKTVGEEFNLNYTITPDTAYLKDVKWSSSNTKVLSVSNGKVKALSKGSANITIQTLDGGYTDTCAINVGGMVTGVTLNKSEMVIVKGTSEMLAASVVPANAIEKGVVWSTSNSKIAGVKDGLVTGVAPGEAVIKVITKDGSFEATTAVTVVSYDVKVTSIDLLDAEVSMNVGENRWFMFKAYPENAVVPKLKVVVTSVSGKTATASIKNNAVYLEALLAGDYTITLSLDTDPSIKDTCIVHIKSMVTDIEISNSNLDIYIGEKLQLTGKALPDTAIIRGVTWKSSDAKIAKINATTGEVEGVSIGNCIITATTIDGGLQKTCRVTVKNPINLESIKLRDSEGNIIGEDPIIEQKQISIFIDGVPLVIDQAPIILNGRVLAPVRAIFESFGATLYWNDDLKTVTGVLGNKIIQLIVDNDKANINGNTVVMDVPAKNVNGRILVPVRFIAESLGINVVWDEDNRSVIITK